MEVNFIGAMLTAILSLGVAAIVGEILGRVVSPPINAWVERQCELEENEQEASKWDMSVAMENMAE